MNRNTLLSICAPLREALLRNRYDTDTLLDTLGPDIHAALGRNEPVPVRRASASCGELGTLIRLFLLGDDCPIAEVAAALHPLSVEAAVDAGLLASDAGVVRAALDLRPIDTGSGNRWVLSDLDGSMRPRETAVDHVIGVGHASLSLLQATPGAPVGSLLDVGTGCGIQALHGTSYAQSVTATDLNVRAVDLAAVTMALNEEEVELLTGSWFEPVEGRTFDQVVANPPFVVSRATVGHTYRDSGLDLDGASRLMISRSPDYLSPGGTAALLASWVHVAGEDWRSRVASWLPAHGIDAWVVQRDVADPALYVGTWMRDGGLDTKDPSAAATAEQWLDHLESADVEGVGFGFVYLRRTDAPSDLLAEDLTHGFDDPLGAEALAYFDRVAWLRENDVLTARFHVQESTALERVFLPGEEGWTQVVARLHRGNGPAWQHEIDDLVASLVAGMRSDGLVLGELIDLLAAAHDMVATVLAESAIPLVHSLVRHGLVLPV
ncbi:SAM-dependent methyltransferase [Rhodococcus oxybenzonivorans]|uniref:SAM-dependent methyltransferase n=1 Tax=Rhodococcus oxybenzonivorans TaxID=1990687 RepID=A0A2S2BWM9_9NOCA|nr:methyltransferase [Rhodococcus oxybenzonivorans]AWK73037.1 SAM-dependent methyltransferase [Rhodococcus oxybenzonivorans]